MVHQPWHPTARRLPRLCCCPTLQAWGHSTAVGPFAELLATTDHQPATVLADMDYDEVTKRRTNLPLRQQKRHDLYLLLDKTA